ncbi:MULTISPECIES: ABC transporter ATP-binding protein [unclassified Streptomyces]|uniref:ABC transporter ATP-binding protein n=1 Tax=Streptomyces TaxID=1883 RepID=UPI0001C18F62|nr:MULTISPECIES: ABC transporter ATP-binding protein [unclassified Streptomyces]AEN08568.1 ABC transporter related protein [Streptomyces sp. SirexAA-E]MYR69498.1 ATP-binding cassette domain-containing protein [Streptomyces sp. SID4939]MYS01255.1 ATP-binding cassette domain-containing protein [Streptomyces sp. SID4940]MYT66287.1 ATP-binding cassette domain-containing protein [Streptomyces sp. SID8357]MYT83207.1 ATP-binding cassette domain-containing protein [Streptomyces sp. SID8360]
MTTPDTKRPRPGSDILRTALRRNIGAMAWGTVLMGLYQAGETAFPIALGLIVEHTLQHRSPGALGLSIAALAVIITTVSLSWRFGMRVLQKANTTEAHRWRVRVAACGLQPVARDVDLKSGEVLTIATEDADQTADIIEVVPLLVSSLVAVLVAAVALGVADIRLGLLVIVGTVGILSILSVMSRRIGSSTREQQARVARAGAKVADLITGLRPLHGFGGNHAAFLSYRKVSTDAKHQAVTVAKVNGVYAGTALALNAVLAAAVTLTAGRLAFDGQITVGELVMAVGLAQFIMEPLKLFSEMPKYVMMARASAERMALVLTAPPVTTPGPERPAPGAGLDIDCVRYGALRELKFHVSAGEFVAIAAYQPRAAADLASILAVNTPPQAYEGVVRIGGREIADLSIEAVRTHMLVNPYDGEIFAGTLRSNIDPSGTSRTVAEAVEASMLTDVVALHRAGLDHAVRDRGANLSGGQRQRLSLARALAADSDILVLHDPTTAVDAVTEQLVARNIAELRRGRTTVVLTSSPALLDAADRVLVLDDGAVTAEDTHRNLLATDEGYCLAVAR